MQVREVLLIEILVSLVYRSMKICNNIGWDFKELQLKLHVLTL